MDMCSQVARTKRCDFSGIATVDLNCVIVATLQSDQKPREAPEVLQVMFIIMENWLQLRFVVSFQNDASDPPPSPHIQSKNMNKNLDKIWLQML